jgi:hypothetical protein
VLALVGSSDSPPRFVAFGAAGGVPGLPPAPKGCESAIDPSQMAGLATGDLWVVGEACPGAVPAVVHWAPGASRPITTPLPRPPGKTIEISALVAASPTDVLVVGDAGGSAYAARFDGATWSLLDVPASHGVIRAAAADGRGGHWVLSSDGVLRRRTPGGDWVQVELPRAGNETLEPGGVQSFSAGEVWLRGVVGGNAGAWRGVPKE